MFGPCITLDLQILGQRHKDLKNGLRSPPRTHIEKHDQPVDQMGMGFGNATKTKRRFFGNIVGHVDDVSDPASLMDWTAQQFDPTLDWDKIKQIKDEWGGKVILKGILDAEDAKMALNVGADAIIVSNHGGRQLDGALSSIKALPAILDAVGDKVEVHMDGGIRSGQDILKAVALGAKGTYINRTFIYGLGAMGEAGVTKVLEVLHKEMDISMALCGHRTMDEVSRDTLLIPKNFGGDWQ